MAKVAPEIPGVVPLEERDETPSPVEYIPRRSRVTQSPPSKVYQTITNEMEAEIREMEENDSRNEIAYKIIKAFIFLMIIAIFAAGAVLIKLKMEKNETQTKPTTANPINPTTVGPNDPTITEPTDPTTTDPSDPTTAQPTDSTTVGSTNPSPTTVDPTDATDQTTTDPAKSCDEGYVFHLTYNGTNHTAPFNAFDPYIGDGFCDDLTNVAECNHDGGDCCGDDVKTDYCTDCICHLTTANPINPTTDVPIDPTTAEPTNPTTTQPTDPTTTGPTGPTTDPTDPCQLDDYYVNWIGDGICDDFINTAECGYDGGDCCGDEVDTDFCNACICHTTNITTVSPTDLTTAEPINPTTDPTTADPAKSCDEGHVFYHYYDGNNYTWPGDYFDFWVGDGYCVDFFNIPECNHDGGDCCGDDVNTDYCNDCICHQ